MVKSGVLLVLTVACVGAIHQAVGAPIPIEDFNSTSVFIAPTAAYSDAPEAIDDQKQDNGPQFMSNDIELASLTPNIRWKRMLFRSPNVCTVGYEYKRYKNGFEGCVEVKQSKVTQSKVKQSKHLRGRPVHKEIELDSLKRIMRHRRMLLRYPNVCTVGYEYKRYKNGYKGCVKVPQSKVRQSKIKQLKHLRRRPAHKGWKKTQPIRH